MTIPVSFKPHFHQIQQDWKDQPAYIIAGGSSLALFNFDSLKGKNVVAVKSSAEYLSWVSCYFSMDIVNWKMSFRLNALQNSMFSGDIIMACHPEHTFQCNVSHCKFVYRNIFPDNVTVDMYPMSIWNDRVFGQNSGYSALNYAFLRGANPIYLLGFDFNKKGYWYDKDSKHWSTPMQLSSRGTLTRDKYIKEQQQQFAKAAEFLKDKCKVYIVGGESSLYGFDRIGYDGL